MAAGRETVSGALMTAEYTHHAECWRYHPGCCAHRAKRLRDELRETEAMMDEHAATAERRRKREQKTTPPTEAA